jgi:ribosomal protein S27AE
MRLTTRLRKLEATKREMGECPRCNGVGWPMAFVQGPPDFDLTTKPGDRIGCDRCGRVSTVLRVVLDATAPDPFAMWQAWRAEQEGK